MPSSDASATSSFLFSSPLLWPFLVVSMLILQWLFNVIHGRLVKVASHFSCQQFLEKEWRHWIEGRCCLRWSCLFVAVSSSNCRRKTKDTTAYDSKGSPVKGFFYCTRASWPKRGLYLLIVRTFSLRYVYIKHLEKICSVCGGHLVSMNFHPRNREGYYAYSSKVGGKLCLLIVVRTLPLLRSRDKNPPIHMPCDIRRFGSW
jgi:hypothetical protein